jgi:hypothetical protein
MARVLCALAICIGHTATKVFNRVESKANGVTFASPASLAAFALRSLLLLPKIAVKSPKLSLMSGGKYINTHAFALGNNTAPFRRRPRRR